MKRLVVALFLCVLVCILNLEAHGQTFTFAPINFPGALGTSANGINASGQIVGSYTLSSTGYPAYGFLYSGGRYTHLPIPGGGYQSANGINARGEIVGSYEDATGTYGFLDSGGVFSRIKYPGAMLTWALGINASGQIVGDYLITPSGPGGVFLKTGNNYQTINYPGSESTSAGGINAAGQIVGIYLDQNGWHVFLYSGGSYTTIDVPGEGPISSVLGINTSGQIVGSYATRNGNHGFLDNDGQFTTIDVPGADHVTLAYGINDGGQIVGEYRSGNTTSGFLADPCGTPGPGQYCSWSGYAVTGAAFTFAKGSWIVPSVNCTLTPDSASSFWVGIDGFISITTLEQIGTQSQCNGSSAEYFAWYEFLPNDPHEIKIDSVPVHPGDVISASITYNGNSSFTARITNKTTGDASPPITATVSGAERGSAEWIAEDPFDISTGDIWPLSDFGIARFGEDYTDVSDTNYATDNQHSGPISAFGSNVMKLTMGSGYGKKAVPSDLTSDGTSFDVVWHREN